MADGEKDLQRLVSEFDDETMKLKIKGMRYIYIVSWKKKVGGEKPYKK